MVNHSSSCPDEGGGRVGVGVRLGVGETVGVGVFAGLGVGVGVSVGVGVAVTVGVGVENIVGVGVGVGVGCSRNGTNNVAGNTVQPIWKRRCFTNASMKHDYTTCLKSDIFEIIARTDDPVKRCKKDAVAPFWQGNGVVFFGKIIVGISASFFHAVFDSFPYMVHPAYE